MAGFRCALRQMTVPMDSVYDAMQQAGQCAVHPSRYGRLASGGSSRTCWGPGRQTLKQASLWPDSWLDRAQPITACQYLGASPTLEAESAAAPPLTSAGSQDTVRGALTSEPCTDKAAAPSLDNAAARCSCTAHAHLSAAQRRRGTLSFDTLQLSGQSSSVPCHLGSNGKRAEGCLASSPQLPGILRSSETL